MNSYGLSARYLKGAQKGGFLRVILYISIGAVALSVFALTIVLGILDGFQNKIRSAILKTTPHVRIVFSNNSFEDRDSVYHWLDKDSRIVAYAPFAEADLLLQTSYSRPRPMLFKAIDPDLEKKISTLYSSLVQGNWEALKQSGAIILGSGLAKRLALAPGDSVTLFSPTPGAISFFGASARWFPATLVGTFKTGFWEIDNQVIFGSMPSAELWGRAGVDFVSGLGVKIKSPDQAEEVAEDIRNQSHIPVAARSWIEDRKPLYTAMFTEKIIMFFVELLLVLIAAFNISSLLVMLVIEKRRDIGLMKALGCSSKFVRNLFLWCGIRIGLMGTGFGYIAGLAVLYFIDKQQIPMPGGGEVYYIDFVPVHYSFINLFLIPFCSFSLCFLSVFYPAWKAAKLNPAETLRYE